MLLFRRCRVTCFIGIPFTIIAINRWRGHHDCLCTQPEFNRNIYYKQTLNNKVDLQYTAQCTVPIVLMLLFDDSNTHTNHTTVQINRNQDKIKMSIKMSDFNLQ